MKSVTALALLAVLTAAEGAAAPPPVVAERTEQRTLIAKENGVAYKLYIALPHGYGAAGARFPVVYLLDADYSFFIARNIADHLSERNHLRELIIVGIAYDGPLRYRINRTRDYTPIFVPTGGYGPEEQKVSGGGPKFRAFLEKELIPFIDSTYATDMAQRCLVGHSYGGLFASWNLLLDPPLFNRYIIVSPSLWYGDRWIFDQEKKFATAHESLAARAYLAVGSSEGDSDHDMVVDLQDFAARLRRIKGLRSKSASLDGETHNSVFPRALSNGLRFVFEGR